MSACLCRTDDNGRRWTNTACKSHGVDSPDEDDDYVSPVERDIAYLMENNQ